MDKYIGKKLDGRYEILELIGAGGMANVYKATDHMDGSVKAVKILREEFLDNEELVRRFKNESKAIGLLNHPNIVKVYDVNFSDSVQYIVMEYLDGITLKQYIDHMKKLGWKDTVYFTTQILKALQHAHDNGIVHRDIKPQNIMMLADGSIKVMDFGIARFARSETRTITDKAIGSVHYISPEQAKGDITDAKADIYSVGVMMYEMLTGELPFVSNSAVSVAIKQISDTPKSLREIDGSIPEGLEEITLKAMIKDPAKRYQSAAQMLRDIDDFKQDPSIVFAYKYLNDDSPTMYIDNAAVAVGAAKATSAKKRSSGGKKKKKRKQNLPTAVLLGITAACLVGALILMLMVFSIRGGGGGEDVELPSFVGMTLSDIENNAEYKDFRFTIVEDYNSEYELGYIYAQSPVPPKEIKSNGEITLYVSKGPEKVTIPDIIDYKYGDGVDLLQKMGLVVTQEQISDDNYDANRIVKTDPVGGTEVLAGTVVTVYVNAYTAPTTYAYVPELVGQNYNAARSLLTENGLMMGEVTYEENPAESGTVLSQSINPGTRVNVGSKVNIVVSTGVQNTNYTANLDVPYTLNGSTTYTLVAKYNGETVASSPITTGTTQPTWAVTVSGTGTAKLEVFAVDSAGVEHLIMTYNIDHETGETTKQAGSDSAFGWSAPAVPPAGGGEGAGGTGTGE